MRATVHRGRVRDPVGHRRRHDDRAARSGRRAGPRRQGRATTCRSLALPLGNGRERSRDALAASIELQSTLRQAILASGPVRPGRRSDAETTHRGAVRVPPLAADLAPSAEPPRPHRGSSTSTQEAQSDEDRRQPDEGGVTDEERALQHPAEHPAEKVERVAHAPLAGGPKDAGQIGRWRRAGLARRLRSRPARRASRRRPRTRPWREAQAGARSDPSSAAVAWPSAA